MTLNGTQRAETVAGNAFVLFRLGGVLQVLIAVSQTYPHFRPLLAGLALVGAVTTESLVLVGIARRHRHVPPVPVMVIDALVLTIAMPCSAALAVPTREGHTWVFFMYPFALLAVVGFGLTVRTIGTLAALVGMIAVSYVWSAVAIIGDPAWNVVPNAVPYLVNATAAWAVARTLRRGGVELDRVNADTARQEAELARRREQARHARLLHDRVLQTMETLASGPWLADDNLRDLVAADASWLRSLVRDDQPPGTPADLIAGLQELAARQSLAGLRVQVHAEQLRSSLRNGRELPPETVDAVLGAVGELLTNVAKHSGVSAAVVRAELSDRRLLVTVLDSGRGFDPTALNAGLGLERSVRAPIETVGGTVLVNAADGSGTYVELTIPL